MPTPSEIAEARYLRRQGLSRAAAERALTLWRQADPGDLVSSWSRLSPRLYGELMAAQRLAARGADDHIRRSLAAAGSTPRGVNRTVETGPVGINGEGVGLTTVLAVAAPVALKLLGSSGGDITAAMIRGGTYLQAVSSSAVADAGRAADQAAMIAEPEAAGWVRKVVTPACSRCLILSGKWYRWSDGFARHPRCNCVHVPATSADAAGVESPEELFAAMSEAEQDASFTRTDAELYRAGQAPAGPAGGTPLARLVNSRSGMAAPRSRASITTLPQTRPTVDDLVARRNRRAAIAALIENGYLAA